MGGAVGMGMSRSRSGGAPGMGGPMGGGMGGGMMSGPIDETPAVPFFVLTKQPPAWKAV